MPREQQLTDVFLDIADSLVSDFDILDFLQQFTTHCAGLLDVATAGVLLGDERGRLQLLAASDENTRMLEVFASEHEQSPCVDCFRSGRPVPHVDLTQPEAVERWPQFTQAARERGFSAMHAFPLRLRDTVVGSLGLFRTTPQPLGQEDVLLAQALADMATIAVLQQRTLAQSETERAQLQYALTSRIILEQAKGVLAERWHCTVDEAFTALRAHTRTHHLRLTELTQDIANGKFDTDQIPHTPTDLKGRPPRK
ncbi:GAF and ANTAR domain-containing protein [Streptomyces sp. NPDC057757]|uniref:GAF and ANTAR domain-containing protein n=1 Tax=Streptomyces sp. NPDC057757 TaxID=3346241 RepID=UPI00369C5F36